ncbi:MAG: pyrimidine/purine nucleoside phosphorylase [Spirochaetia bacterium]|nr:pyrimidine/purine nucleoside phosphorylase [Spirochaetia bacterium]
MTQYNNVHVIKKANQYFNGNVTSRTILFGDGAKKTLGIMMPGEYEFQTGDKEIMEIYSGSLEVQLPGSSEWKFISDGQSFEVPANSKFTMKVKTLSDYCCSFIKE